MVYAHGTQISDLPVNVSLHRTASPVLTQHPIRFEPPHSLYFGTGDALVGRLGDYGGELLGKLVADDELILQYTLSSAPLARTTGKRSTQNTSQFLGVIMYGPRRRFSDVGDFMTRAGCYLEDPVGCDRNVPYMNPQCLFSLYESPPMTFGLLSLQQPHVGDFTRDSLDVLSGFETTDDFEPSAKPTALRTELKLYVISMRKVTLLRLKLQTSKTSTYFLLETRTRHASKQRRFRYMAAKNKWRRVCVRFAGIVFKKPMLNFDPRQVCERFDG